MTRLLEWAGAQGVLITDKRQGDRAVMSINAPLSDRLLRRMRPKGAEREPD
jgi:hypothetical protein